MKAVPVVPDHLREEKYSKAVRDYINDEIDEDELESEIEGAMLGRISFDELLKIPELMSPHEMEGPGDNFQIYGVEIEHGESVTLDETPNLFEDPLVVGS